MPDEFVLSGIGLAYLKSGVLMLSEMGKNFFCRFVNGIFGAELESGSADIGKAS